MVAPVDAKATFEVEGESITLRLNFRAIALAEKHGVDLLNDGAELNSITQGVTVLMALGMQDHPDYTEDHWLAIAMNEPKKMRGALLELFSQFGGKADAGNGAGRKAKQAA